MSSQSPKAKTSQLDLSDSLKETQTTYSDDCPQCRTEDESSLKPEEFALVGTAEFLELDPRPTFIVAQNTDFGDRSIIDPVFYNSAFHSQLFQIICRKAASSPTHSLKASNSAFRSWMARMARFEPDEPSDVPNFTFCGYDWTTFLLRDRWIVFSGSLNPLDNKSETRVTSRLHRSESPFREKAELPQIQNEILLSRTSNIKASNNLLEMIPLAPANFVTPGTPDWTVTHPVGELSPHIIFARSIDWASTSLGDMNTWSREFRQVVNLLMRNPHAAAIFYGEELTCIYNKAYADGVAGHKHPGLMGTGFRGPFAELWDFVSATFDDCVKTYVSIWS